MKSGLVVLDATDEEKVTVRIPLDARFGIGLSS